ncbi:hypothetical protein MBAV_005274 [Candidatus Magnetobacterium bavaricum]|uniref:Uncharacterized protein n=1 Tax=Candidatus Magnetobacterium bavaricum TaxID=29290 RepID=A0A0F3GPB6_9BACT|nr:hypothetical protein MBAV_005274 [Candidatus Magnetobacterium bavaricum]
MMSCTNQRRIIVMDKIPYCSNMVLYFLIPSYFIWATQLKNSDQRERVVQSTALPFICFPTKTADIKWNMSSLRLLILPTHFDLGFGWIDTAIGEKTMWMRVSSDVKKMACIYTY